MLKIIQENQPWYSKGLHFSCTGCGKCCTGEPGYVWVTEEEIENMAKFLNISVKDFIIRYVRRVQGKFALTENRKTFDCVFLKDKMCQVYDARPTQCRTYPWWPQNLKTEKDWEEAARYCEGIRTSAPLVPVETIEKQLALQNGTTADGNE